MKEYNVIGSSLESLLEEEGILEEVRVKALKTANLYNLLREIDILQAEINNRPLDEYLLKQIKEYFRIGLTYTSNSLEGNSLTETETKIVLEDGITIGGKPLVDHLEAIGHSDAFYQMYMLAQKKEISEDDVKKLHWLFYYRIDEKNAGVYRTVPAFITGSKYPLPQPQELQQLMHNFIDQTKKIRAEKHPIEAAALIHKNFVFIHPFIDGNGRVARLLMNLVLLQSGYTIAIIPPIIRSTYITVLEKAHTHDTDFLILIAQMVKETQKDYLRLFFAL
jgi:Fic family protein